MPSYSSSPDQGPQTGPAAQELAQAADLLEHLRQVLVAEPVAAGQAEREALAEALRDELAVTRHELSLEMDDLRETLAAKVSRLDDALQREAQERVGSGERATSGLQRALELLGMSLAEQEGRLGSRLDNLEQTLTRRLERFEKAQRREHAQLREELGQVLKDLG